MAVVGLLALDCAVIRVVADHFVSFGLVAALLGCCALVDTDSSIAAVLDEYLAFVAQLTGAAVFPNGFLWSVPRSSTYDALVRQAEMAVVLTVPQLVVGLLGGSTVLFAALCCGAPRTGSRSTCCRQQAEAFPRPASIQG
jgi:hypothetical protein